MKFDQNWIGARLFDGGEEIFAASVPGNIQYDYAVSRGFGDVMYGENALRFEALEDDGWEYRTRLEYEAADGERVFFVSRGIDYKYEIRLNGETIYAYEGMFRPVELDITDRLRGGDELTVHIFPHPKRPGAPAGTRDEADHSAKPPVCYGWDWNPRLLISGMWREAYVETRRADHIDLAEAFYTLSPGLDRAEVRLEIDCAAPCAVSLFDPDGALIYKGENKPIAVDDPRLWWCAGQGEAALYRWEVENPSGMKVSGRLGFRRVRLVREEGSTEGEKFPKSRYAAPFTLELNGRRVFMKGSNLVNPELFWGRATAQTYRRLADLAAEANMNTLRLWGGASMHHPALYERCDELGLLVWQEFPLACNNYPDDDGYLAVLESEAAAMITALRGHPCVFLWCGGNELFNTWSGMTDQSLPLRLLAHLCYALDRDRPFIMTSPLCGMGHGGYLFYDRRNDADVYKCFRNAKNTAYTEFGVPSISALEALEKIIPPDELCALAPTKSWVLHHAFEAWQPESHASLSVLERYFGKDATLAERVAQSDLLQSEGLKFIFEEARRQSPRCGAALNWAFNEPWICAANLSIVRYPDVPKPAYFAVKDALRPALFSASFEKIDWQGKEVFEAKIWLLNDSPEAVAASAEVFIELGGERIALTTVERAAVGANENAFLGEVRLTLPNADAKRMKLVICASDARLSSEYEFIFDPAE